jgi:hypothetical protein
MLIDVRFAVIILDFDVRIFKIPLRCSWLIVIGPDSYREVYWLMGFTLFSVRLMCRHYVAGWYLVIGFYYYFATTRLDG